MRKFTITEDHLKLARKMYVGWNDCEFGAPEIDPKRPYGNRYVYGDIAEIIGMQPVSQSEEPFSQEQRNHMAVLHKQMECVLQIGLSTGSFEVGNYEGEDYGNGWIKA